MDLSHSFLGKDVLTSSRVIPNYKIRSRVWIYSLNWTVFMPLDLMATIPVELLITLSRFVEELERTIIQQSEEIQYLC